MFGVRLKNILILVVRLQKVDSVENWQKSDDTSSESEGGPGQIGYKIRYSGHTWNCFLKNIQKESDKTR